MDAMVGDCAHDVVIEYLSPSKGERSSTYSSVTPSTVASEADYLSEQSTPPVPRARPKRNKGPRNMSKFATSPGLLQSESPFGPKNIPSAESQLPLPIDCTRPHLAKKPITPATPADVASTKWRSLHCPLAPAPGCVLRAESGLSSPCSGLVTPRDRWRNGVDTPLHPRMLTDFSLESSGPATPSLPPGSEVEVSKGKQIGVSPTALSLAIASAKLNASLGCSASRSLGNNLEAGALEPQQGPGGQGVNRRQCRLTMEALIETGLTMDSLPDLQDPASPESCASPRSSCHSDASDFQEADITFPLMNSLEEAQGLD